MALDTAVFDARGLALLVETLTNPTDMHALCSIALRELCIPFYDAQQDQTVQTKNAQLSHLLRAAMKFLTFPKSEDMLSSVKRHLSICECDLDDTYLKTLHPSAAGCGHRSYDRFILILTSIIGFALVDLCPGQLQKRRKGKTSDTQPWPHSESDLLGNPSTCRKTLDMLLPWARDIASGAGIFIVLNGLLQYWEPFSRELGTTPEVFTLARDHLNFALAKYEETQDISDFRFTYPLLSVGNRFFPSLRCLPMKFVLQMLSPTYADLFVISARFQPILPLLVGFERAEEWFGLILTLDKHRFVDVADDLGSASGRHGDALSTMVQIRNQNKCMSVGCPSPPGKRTLHCVRCGVVRYCGSSCQRNAWGAAIAPHKPLCKAIHALRHKLMLEDTTEWSNWVAYYTAHNPGGSVTDERRAEFSALCEARDVDTADSENVRASIQRLIDLCG
ncbi:hypothetical protein B0H11DRAFT_2296340 [Mycena galericulata]|nr:hypothetical protein B0H11DRAFT_2296340 [Mycena galericulata]